MKKIFNECDLLLDEFHELCTSEAKGEDIPPFTFTPELKSAYEQAKNEQAKNVKGPKFSFGGAIRPVAKPFLQMFLLLKDSPVIESCCVTAQPVKAAGP